MTLFRDFLRHFPRARVEDYYKDGRWLREQLEVDLALVAHHRREAGAPDPTPLEEIPAPELPRYQGPPGGGPRRPPPPPPRGGEGSPRGPIGGKDRGKGRSEADVGARRAKPKPPSAPPSSSAVEAQRGVVGPNVRAINDFAAKWKLDSLRLKILLGRLPAARRQEILDTFRPSERDRDPRDAFEHYMAERMTSLRAGGTKRPLPSGSSYNQREDNSAKRPRGDSAIGAAPRTPPGRSPPPRRRSPPPRAGGARGGAAPPPWRDAGGPPPRRMPAPTPKPPSRDAGKGASGTHSRSATAADPNGNKLWPRSTPAVAPKRPSSSPAAAVLMSEDAKPGDLIKNLLG